ncbi:MAG: DUF4258 domain-containing protein [candidate division KSB1 bacterium]|nr:DUF4258 domain-containing protein [candidate division KSB1 bacterium]MDZ7364959.1 DUF4258 domain-containing protein [candidate division KSB1 bacterium]MDZ7403354.1 DUF4258 domain-containing protein [candidate division KSB1 bacterium]
MAKISDLRRKIALELYELTSHAKLEMQDDGFSIEDVKQGIYSGHIVERQRDPFTSTKVSGVRPQMDAKFSLFAD